MLEQGSLTIQFSIRHNESDRRWFACSHCSGKLQIFYKISIIFFFPNVILLLYSLSVNFPAFLSFYSGLHTLRNRAWEGGKYLPAWHTFVYWHFHQVPAAKSSGLHQAPSLSQGRKLFQAAPAFRPGRGCLHLSFLWNRQEPALGAAQEQAGLPGAEATAALILLQTLCSSRDGNVPG